MVSWLLSHSKKLFNFKDKNIAETVIFVAIALCPLFIINWLHGTNFSIRTEYQLAFQSIVIVLVALKHPNKWLGALLIWCLISHYIHGFKPSSAYYLSMAFMGMVWFMFVFLTVTNRKRALSAIALSCLFVIATMLADLIGLTPLTIGDFTIGMPVDIAGNPMKPNWLVTGLPGVIAQQNMTGMYLAVGLPIFFSRYKWAFGLMVAGLIMTKANWAIIAGFAGILTYQIVRPNRQARDIVVSLFIGAFLAIAFCYADRPDYVSRLGALNVIWDIMTPKAILIGNGLAAFPTLGLKWLKMHAYMLHANNEYAEIYFELGIIGLALVMGYIGHLIIRIKRTIKLWDDTTAVIVSCAVAFLMTAFGTHVFHHALIALVGLTVLALAEKKLQLYSVRR